MSENGLQKSANQRVRHQLPGLRLRNEQSSYEEWMIGNLDDSDFSIKISARYDQIRVSSQCIGVLGIDSESTVVAFDYFISSVKGADRRMRLESYTQFHAHERTTQGADEKPGSIRIVFGMLGIDKAEHVSGKFKDHVLKAAAGPPGTVRDSREPGGWLGGRATNLCKDYPERPIDREPAECQPPRSP